MSEDTDLQGRPRHDGMAHVVIAAVRATCAAWRRRAAALRAPADRLSLRGLTLHAAVAAAVATLTVALFYPGLYTQDSVRQWYDADAILTAPDLAHVVVPLWYPPLMSFAMAAVLWLTGAVWPFAWLQYFLFLLAVLLLLAALIAGAGRVLLAFALMLLLPPFWSLFAYVESSTWNATGLGLVLAGILLSGAADPRVRLALLGLAALGLPILFGFRYNTLPLILPVGLLWMLVAASRRAAVAMLATLVVAAAAFAILPKVSDLAGRVLEKRQLPTILVWEIVGTMKMIDGPAAEAYALPQLGDFDAALRRHSWVWQGTLIFGDDPPLDQTRFDPGKDAIEQDWRRIVLDHPAAYLAMKLRVWSVLAGLDLPNNGSEMDFDPRLSPLPLRPALRDQLAPGVAGLRPVGDALLAWKAGLSPGSAVNWLYLEWLWVLVGLAATVVVQRRTRSPAVWLVTLGGLMNWAMFFIFTPSTVFRYFFPTFACCAVVLAAAVVAGRTRRSA